MRSEHRHLISKEYQHVSLVERDNNLTCKKTENIYTIYAERHRLISRMSTNEICINKFKRVICI